MKIINDLVTFDAADFDGFSDSAKKALSVYLEDYSAHFANVLNALVVTAKQHARNLSAQEEPVAAVLESYANADEAKRKSAEPLLADLDNHLKS